MKHFIYLIALFTSLSLNLSAQTLQIGSKAPELKIKEWHGGKIDNKKPILLEFFHSASPPSVKHLAHLHHFATKYKDKINFVLISKQDKSQIFPLTGENSEFIIALDNQEKTFNNFGVKFVPFSVLISDKGRILWFGNSNSFSEKVINEYL